MPEFELRNFMPYLLAQAAERASQGFSQVYKDRYGMLRTDWRVLFHLGNLGPLTARDICHRADLHKTKVSRAVARLEEKRFLTRAQDKADRRVELLTLTPAGQATYQDLRSYAETYEAKLLKDFDATERAQLRTLLVKLAQDE